MGLVEFVKELFRPELQIDQDIVERERRFNEEDSDREAWVLNYVKLYERSLEELKKGVIIGCYFKKGRQPKRVKVKLKGGLNIESDVRRLERELKLALHDRGCNSGINYRLYEKGDYLIGEAIPAITE